MKWFFSILLPIVSTPCQIIIYRIVELNFPFITEPHSGYDLAFTMYMGFLTILSFMPSIVMSAKNI